MTGSSDGSVYYYDVLSGKMVSSLHHHSSVVRDVTMHPELPLMVSCSWDGRVAAWDFSGRGANEIAE